MSEKIYNMVDLETIEKLADIVAAKELGEITIADGEKYITVKGKKCPPPMPLAGAPVAASPAVSAAAPAAPAETPAVSQKPAGKSIKAPLVGTFYAAPSPDQPPFVQVGDTDYRIHEADERSHQRRGRRSTGNSGEKRRCGRI